MMGIDDVNVAALANLFEHHIVEGFKGLPKLDDPFTALMKKLTGGARMKALEKELGRDYIHYKNIQNIREMRGLQSIVPLDIELK